MRIVPPGCNVVATHFACDPFTEQPPNVPIDPFVTTNDDVMLEATSPCVPSTMFTSSARVPALLVTRILYVRTEPGVTGSGPAPGRTALSSVSSIARFGDVDTAVTCVLTSDDVLFSSFDSAIVLSGSTEAVFVIVPARP